MTSGWRRHHLRVRTRWEEREGAILVIILAIGLVTTWALFEVWKNIGQ
jgi:hypothetical protein